MRAIMNSVLSIREDSFRPGSQNVPIETSSYLSRAQSMIAIIRCLSVDTFFRTHRGIHLAHLRIDFERVIRLRGEGRDR